LTNYSLQGLIVDDCGGITTHDAQAIQKGMSVAENIARFKESVGALPVTLIAVTKNADSAQIQEAFLAGVTEFGENRLQDALARRKQLPPNVAQGSRWHFIGHLQTNKAKQVVGNFELIHSVDSFHLAQQLSKVAGEQKTKQAILLQVKVLDDPNKYGFSPDELRQMFAQLLQLPHLEIRGLMTMTPMNADLAAGKACFSGLSQLRDELVLKHGVQLQELSMGMTDDWQQAVSCGATMVRLGRAIFGH
jgi:PLP dependent protein